MMDNKQEAINRLIELADSNCDWMEGASNPDFERYEDNWMKATTILLFLGVKHNSITGETVYGKE